MDNEIQSTLIIKGIAGGPDAPPAQHAIATMVFADMNGLQTASSTAAPKLADIVNFTNVQPQMLIGEVIG